MCFWPRFLRCIENTDSHFDSSFGLFHNILDFASQWENIAYNLGWEGIAWGPHILHFQFENGLVVSSFTCFLPDKYTLGFSQNMDWPFFYRPIQRKRMQFRKTNKTCIFHNLVFLRNLLWIFYRLYVYNLLLPDIGVDSYSSHHKFSKQQKPWWNFIWS